MAAFFAIYHGPEGLKSKAQHAHLHTLLLAEGLSAANHQVVNSNFFDTIKVKPSVSVNEIRRKAEAKHINLRYFEDNQHVNKNIHVYWSVE